MVTTLEVYNILFNRFVVNMSITEDLRLTNSPKMWKIHLEMGVIHER